MLREHVALIESLSAQVAEQARLMELAADHNRELEQRAEQAEQDARRGRYLIDHWFDVPAPNDYDARDINRAGDRETLVQAIDAAIGKGESND